MGFFRCAVCDNPACRQAGLALSLRYKGRFDIFDSMNLSFRPATEADITIISQLGNKIWREHYPSIISHEQIEFMLSDRYSAAAIEEGMKGEEQYFLAFAGNEAVALADIERDGDGYFLHKLYVDVSSHRTGIGHRFFKYILEQIEPGKDIRLQVNRKNYKAVNFYFKEGFFIETVGDFDIGGGFFMNDFVMLRRGA